MRPLQNSLLSLLIIVLCITALSTLPFFVACTNDDDDDDDDSTDTSYVPLNAGNRWDFIATAEGESGTGSALVKPQETFNGTTAIPIEITETSEQDQSPGYIYLTSDSARVNMVGGLFDDQQYPFNKPFTCVTFPLSVGKSWDSDTSITVEGIPFMIDAATTVVALENITVQGKNYANCYKLVSNVTVKFTVVIPFSITFPVNSWLAPNVGAVKTIMTVPSVPLFPELPEGDMTVEVTGTNF